MNKVFSKPFLRSLFIKQNKYHAHGVLVHTLRVMLGTIKYKRLDMLPAAIMHDFGKPFTAWQDDEDIRDDTYSFTNHEEMSYQIIKDWSFVSDYTKLLVRYHYIIRDMKKCKKKGNFARYNRLHKIWEKIPNDFREELEIFMKIDDFGKGYKYS